MKRTPETRFELLPRLLVVAVGLGIVTGPALPLEANEAELPAAAPDLLRGSLVRIKLPIQGDNPAPIKARLERAVDRLLDPAARVDERRPALILELVPATTSRFGEGCSFAAAYEVADALLSNRYAGVRTIAYIPETIKGHGVLIGLACEEIVMASGAEFGEAGVDEVNRATVKSPIVEAYRYVTQARMTVPVALALGMVDRSLEVLRIRDEGTVRFVTRGDLDAILEERTLIADPETVIAAGGLGSFTAAEGKRYEFVRAIADDRDDLANRLQLAASAIVEDQTLEKGWQPVLLDLDGELSQRRADQIINMLRDERETQRANWVVLRINSRGGDIQACLSLAAEFARYEASEFRTVAYVSGEARGGAAMIALACDQIVMNENGVLGGDGFEPVDAAELEAVQATVRDPIAKGRRDWSPLMAMLDPELRVFPYRHRQTGRVRLFSEVEASEQPDADQWERRGEAITVDGQALEVDPQQARSMGLSWHTVGTFTEFKQLFGIEQELRVVKPNWALELIAALASPGLAIMLLVLGFMGVYIELHSPGVGIGGFIAAVAFLLFFWSNFLNGNVVWFEVLLFVGGVAFVLLEAFVLPGFGIFGLGGGAMILSSLVLASQTFLLPHSTQEMNELRNSLLVVAAAGIFCMVGSVAIRRYLPHTPLFNRILLNPPDTDELADIEDRETLVDFAYLIGEQGIALTDLRPAGRAEFRGELVDVIAEGDQVSKGERIEVVSARANRVKVRAI